jgi:outer membrane receptor for ferrienterochelin and colicins
MGRTLTILLLNLIVVKAVAQSRAIQGNIYDAETHEPMPFASLWLLHTTNGTSSDEHGNFLLTVPASGQALHLVVSFTGYKTDTLTLSQNQKRYSIGLKPDYKSLQEVVVISGTMKEVSKLNSPIPVEVYTPALFLKNPTPTIFESLGMINGVQPQLNCNVCNTGDIHINGMEGPYTMVLIDGMPIVSSLSTVYGLSGIPNSMVKRIEVVKGPASTLYGSEAVGGLINIITKDPGTSPRFKADVSGTSLGEYNIDIATKWRTRKTEALLGLNYFRFSTVIDVNDDNFTDVTLQDRFSVFNKWTFKQKQDRESSLAFRYVYEDRWGGELNWTKRDRGSDQIYGESIYTNRAEVIGTWQLPVTKEKITFDYSFNDHVQDSYYGISKYQADQQVAFAQLRWDKKIKSHDFLFGLPFRWIRYEDNTAGTPTAMNTYLPGIFVQDEIALNDKFTLLSGLRYDHHNEHKHIVSPRLSAKYAPNSRNTIRVSAGNGFRVVNLFTEDHAALTGAREVVIKNELRPETSWNANINYATTRTHASGYVGVDISVFYTYFTNKIVGDFLTDPDLILYDNLDGHAVSRGLTFNTDIAFTSGLKFILGVTMMDVYQKQKQNSDLNKTPQLFAPVVSGTYAISYTLDRIGLSIDLTGKLNGPMYLPVVPNDYRPEKSPWYTIMNIQFTKTFTNGFELYTGLKNITNFMPEDPLLRPFDPFDKNITIDNPNGYTFDTSYNYAPIQGIKAFGGIRYTFQ